MERSVKKPQSLTLTFTFQMKFSVIFAFFVLSTVCSLADGADGPYLSALKIQARGDRTAPIKDYGADYGTRKRKTVAALKKAGINAAQLALAVAIGMQETSTFKPSDYDASKTGDATNYSAFNFNRDMLARAGVTASNSFNTWDGIDAVASAYKKMVATYGVNGFLNYQRGGYTAWKDGHSYDAAGYRNAMASIVRYIDKDPSLLNDNRRVEMYTAHQG